MSPPLIPPKGGRRMKGMTRFLLSQTNQPVFSKFAMLGFYRLGKVTRDF